jgi:hypothetical protein
VVLPAIRIAVDRLTLKEAATICGTQPSQLSDALNERDRKSVKAEWLTALIVAAPEAIRRELVAAINRVGGYKPPEQLRELTPAEELAIWKRAVGRLSPGIVDAIEQEVSVS